MNRKEDRHVKSIKERRADKRKRDLKDAGENKKQKSLYDCFTNVVKSSEPLEPCLNQNNPPTTKIIEGKTIPKICSISFDNNITINYYNN